jgi:hypothetical protein
MIFPGHVAASLLASRHLDVDLRLTLVAGLAPDLLDKTLFYVLHVTHWTRIPGHSPFVLVLSGLAVALAGRLWRHDWRWGASWCAGYTLHLLCDLVPGEGVLPWLWPWDAYAGYVSSGRPWFLGGGPVPWLAVVAEAALVAAAVAQEVARQRRLRARVGD